MQPEKVSSLQFWGRWSAVVRLLWFSFSFFGVRFLNEIVKPAPGTVYSTWFCIILRSQKLKTRLVKELERLLLHKRKQNKTISLFFLKS